MLGDTRTNILMYAEKYSFVCIACVVPKQVDVHVPRHECNYSQRDMYLCPVYIMPKEN